MSTLNPSQALISALLALGAPQTTALQQACDLSAPHAHVVTDGASSPRDVRVLADELLLDMKADPALAARVEADPHSTLASRGLSAFATEAQSAKPMMKCVFTCFVATSCKGDTCDVTCAFTSWG